MRALCWVSEAGPVMKASSTALMNPAVCSISSMAKVLPASLDHFTRHLCNLSLSLEVESISPNGPNQRRQTADSSDCSVITTASTTGTASGSTAAEHSKLGSSFPSLYPVRACLSSPTWSAPHEPSSLSPSTLRTTNLLKQQEMRPLIAAMSSSVMDTIMVQSSLVQLPWSQPSCSLGPRLRQSIPHPHQLPLQYQQVRSYAELSRVRLPKSAGFNDTVMPNNTTLKFGQYGIRAMNSRRVPAATIEALRRTLRRKIKKSARLWIRIAATVPVTKKPEGIRMGKGKGPISYYATPVRPGQIMFEFDRLPRALAVQAMNSIQPKIAIRLGFVEWS